jgi:hypothetical protein
LIVIEKALFQHGKFILRNNSLLLQLAQQDSPTIPLWLVAGGMRVI